MSLTKVSYSMITGAVINILDYGADKTGVADSTVAINAAITAAGYGATVYLPTGTYKITSSILLNGCNILGDGRKTIIQPSTDNFAAISSNSVAMQKFFIRGLYIDYSVATGGAFPTNANSIGIKFLGAALSNPFEFQIEQIWIRYAYYGFKDDSASYMYTLDQVRVDNSMNAFYLGTLGKTTITFNNCYANNFKGSAYYFYAIDGLNFLSGAFDSGNNTTTGSSMMLFATCQGVNVSGIDFESNTITGGSSAAIKFSNVSGFNIQGLRPYANTYATGTSDSIVISVNDGSVGAISGITLPASDVSTGSGNAICVYVSDASKLTIDSSVLGNIAGTATPYSLKVIDTSSISVSETTSLASANILGTNAKVVNNSLSLISNDVGNADISFVPGLVTPILYFNTPITADRYAYLGLVGLYTGAQVTVVRTAAATGAFNVKVYNQVTSTTLVNLTAGNSVTLVYTGSAWAVVSKAAL
jgi:hypothetical protein